LITQDVYYIMHATSSQRYEIIGLTVYADVFSLLALSTCSDRLQSDHAVVRHIRTTHSGHDRRRTLQCT